MNQPSLSIVVPVYNECESLRDLQKAIETTPALQQISCEVIYVDDGSTDGSWETLVELHEQKPEQIRVIRLRRNFGQTAAIAAGFDASRGEIVVPMDADLQNDPSDIPRLLEKLNEGFDIVSGWRKQRKDPLSRRVSSAIANFLISRITGVYLHDYGCTLKAYRREVVEQLELYGEMHRFLPALASWSGAQISEIEVNHHPRTRGVSKYGLGRTTRVLIDLITVKFLLSYSTKPMQVFGKWGFLAICLGVAMGLLTAVLKIFPPHQDVTGNPWMYLCIFFVLGGMQLIAVGLLGEINVRTYYESRGKPIYTIRAEKGTQSKPDKR